MSFSLHLMHHSMKYALAFFFISLSSCLLAQEYTLEWRIEARSGSPAASGLTFKKATYSPYGLPIFSGQYPVPGSSEVQLELFGEKYEALTGEELTALGHLIDEVKEGSYDIQQHFTEQDGKYFVRYSIPALRRNETTREIEKLVSFDLLPEIVGSVERKTSTWAQSSMLGSGDWIKVPISNSGLHVISVDDLISAGIVTSGMPSSQLQAYHNGGGMLPESIAANRFDDLRQIGIHIEDGGDDQLNSGDQVYFFAHGPDEVVYSPSTNRLEHRTNVYSRFSYVFFSANANTLSFRVDTQTWNGGSATMNSTGFHELKFHEQENVNIAGTGREWYGEIFDFQLSSQIRFNFPNRITSEPLTLRFRAAAAAPNSTTRFLVSENGTAHLSLGFTGIGGSNKFTTNGANVNFTSSSNDIVLDIDYERFNAPSATGYLDFVSVMAKRSWIYSNGGFIARDLDAISVGDVVEYTYADFNSWVWDITDPTRPFIPVRDVSGSWLASGDSLRTYMVARPADAQVVSSWSSVANQNLHAEMGVDMLLVVHPTFISEANRLADYHRTHDDLNVLVVTPEQVYNEFSGGAQDVTAIRDAARMFYKRDDSDPLLYLLLMGDASYDYLNRLANKQNFVPIYESVNSSSLYTSFMTDDYYACLDDIDGRDVIRESVDISTGRLPVKTLAEARTVVDKITQYADAANSFGDWRNRICFVTDDVDEPWESRLTRDPEDVAQEIDTVYPYLNFEKIYSDSYSQVSTSGSQSYPSAREALYRSVERGNLITAYTGHGGEVGWASERLLQLQDINSWTNGYRLPLFVTITCEFTRLDDPNRTSAGEQLFLNPNGGAIALISTTRVVFVEGALSLNDSVFANLMELENDQFLPMGEVVRRAKNAVFDGDRVRFSLIGDPALRLNIAKHDVVLDSVNGVHVSQADTLRAREKVTLSGKIVRNTGGLFSDFNGEVVVTIFDKAEQRQTKKNDGVGASVNFIQQENIIFRGRASVVEGLWEISFIVPRDINYTFGAGKISLYADNGLTDAKGADRTLYVGGLGDPDFVDNTGPEIRLFMNDTNFVSGGLTDDSPTGLALLFDESGINVVGNGLGHNVVGILDGDASNSFNLNSYYEGDLNSYQTGKIEYPFFNLSNGPHTLKVRVWDVMNNVSEADVNFVVAERDQLKIQDLFNYPNPFTEVTNFSFEHNREGDELEVDLYIIDLNGRMVNHQNQTITPEGTRTLDMTWDGTGGNGTKVTTGVYVFRLVVRSKADGSEAQLSERLVYLK